MNAEERWKRLEEYIQNARRAYEEDVMKYDDRGRAREANRRDMCTQANRDILDEMARLEKED